MRNLKSSVQNPKNSPLPNFPAHDIDPAAMDSIQAAIDQYSGKSQNELMQELVNARRSGLIDPAQLSAVTSQLLPMLPQDQRQRLQDILNQLE